MVTIQLPVYNEKYVVERLLDAVIKIQWPPDALEIQVLDDSTDETSALIKTKLAGPLFQKHHFTYLHRHDRAGFKAGALQAGLHIAHGEFIAIFDADFIPDVSFLKDTMPEFDRSEMGMVQTKWEHLNKNYSLLTRLQAFGLNGHFRVEQSGRSQAGSFINFNGTTSPSSISSF